MAFGFIAGGQQGQLAIACGVPLAFALDPVTDPPGARGFWPSAASLGWKEALSSGGLSPKCRGSLRLVPGVKNVDVEGLWLRELGPCLRSPFELVALGPQLGPIGRLPWALGALANFVPALSGTT